MPWRQLQSLRKDHQLQQRRHQYQHGHRHRQHRQLRKLQARRHNRPRRQGLQRRKPLRLEAPSAAKTSGPDKDETMERKGAARVAPAAPAKDLDAVEMIGPVVSAINAPSAPAATVGAGDAPGCGCGPTGACSTTTDAKEGRGGEIVALSPQQVSPPRGSTPRTSIQVPAPAPAEVLKAIEVAGPVVGLKTPSVTATSVVKAGPSAIAAPTSVPRPAPARAETDSPARVIAQHAESSAGTRRAILREARKASLAARSTNREDPRATRARWKASFSRAAKDSRRQAMREDVQEKKGDEMLASPAVFTPAVQRVRCTVLATMHRAVSELRVARRRRMNATSHLSRSPYGPTIQVSETAEVLRQAGAELESGSAAASEASERRVFLK